MTNHVNRFYNIIKVLQDDSLSLDKHDLTNWQSSWKTLEYWMQEHEAEIQESIQEAWESIPYHDLYPLPSYALRSTDYYFNHLLSKVVDYFPKGRSLTPLADLVNVFVENQSRLEDFVELGLHWWVYVFTENMRYVPYTFKQLNGVEGLGKHIETWVKPDNPDPVIELVKEAGYNQVFAGWGGIKLTHLVKEEEGNKEDKSVPEATGVENENKPDGSKWFTIPNKDWTPKLLQHLRATLIPYIDNSLTDPTNVAHVTTIIRTMATTIMYFTDGKPLRRSDFSQVLAGLKSIFKKHDGFARRKDKRTWFLDTWIKPTNLSVEEMVSQVNSIPTLIIQKIFNSIVLPYKLRLATEEEKQAHFDTMIKKLIHFLDDSYKEIYYSEKFNYNELAVANMLVLYTNYLAPRYASLVEKDHEHIFLSAMEYWLDIYDPNSAGTILDEIRLHFEKRRSTEENEQLVKALHYPILLLAKRNKGLLDEGLKTILNEIPNYGKSHQSITELINLNQQEMVRLANRKPPRYEVDIKAIEDGKYTYTVAKRDMFDIYNEIDKSRPHLNVKDVSI